jgi:very-short-patch-repair endonuclease
MNFGPINASGGERRWNVAVARARYESTLVCSMTPTQLDPLRSSLNRGPASLAAYLDYAYRKGELFQPVQSVGEAESEFEEQVRRALEAQGLQVDANVGASGFRIDLAVRHPEYPSRYVAGIECDWATYHSSRTARDRDRLREEILRGLGWRIVRVWSTDWIRNPRASVDRVVDLIRKYQAEGVPSTVAAVPPAPGQSWVTDHGDNEGTTNLAPKAVSQPNNNVELPRKLYLKFPPSPSSRSTTFGRSVVKSGLMAASWVVAANDAREGHC